MPERTILTRRTEGRRFAGGVCEDSVSEGGPAISAHARRCCCPRRLASVGPIGAQYTERDDVAQDSLIISELAITKPQAQHE